MPTHCQPELFQPNRLLRKHAADSKKILCNFLVARHAKNMGCECRYIKIIATFALRQPHTRSDARVVEEARLESVYTSKAYRGFESPSLRKLRDYPNSTNALQNIARRFVLFQPLKPLKSSLFSPNLLIYGFLYSAFTSIEQCHRAFLYLYDKLSYILAFFNPSKYYPTHLQAEQKPMDLQIQCAYLTPLPLLLRAMDEE